MQYEPSGQAGGFSLLYFGTEPELVRPPFTMVHNATVSARAWSRTAQLNGAKCDLAVLDFTEQETELMIMVLNEAARWPFRSLAFVPVKAWERVMEWLAMHPRAPIEICCSVATAKTSLRLHIERALLNMVEQNFAVALEGQMSRALGDASGKIRRLNHLAHRDPLTDAGNRRALGRRFLRASARSRRVGLIVIDVDSLKQINDRFGHLAGDRALQDVTNCIRESIPPNLVYRIGGDEFVVLQPRTRREALLELTANLVERCRNIGVVPTSISAGCAHVRELAEPNLTSLLELADGRLYAARASARSTARAGLGAVPRGQPLSTRRSA